MKITVQDLENKRACQLGIRLFQKIYGDEHEFDWTLGKQIEIIKSPLGKYFGWAVYNGLLPMWSMAGANLAGADLANANLTRADLANVFRPENDMQRWGYEANKDGYLVKVE